MALSFENSFPSNRFAAEANPRPRDIPLQSRNAHEHRNQTTNGEQSSSFSPSFANRTLAINVNPEFSTKRPFFFVFFFLPYFESENLQFPFQPMQQCGKWFSRDTTRQQRTELINRPFEPAIVTIIAQSARCTTILCFARNSIFIEVAKIKKSGGQRVKCVPARTEKRAQRIFSSNEVKWFRQFVVFRFIYYTIFDRK